MINFVTKFDNKSNNLGFFVPDEPTAPEQSNHIWRHAPTFYNCPKTDWHEEHPPGSIQPN